MKSALFKDTFREIKKTKGRFISIFAIITLGVAFFVGIKSASPVMEITADKYYDDTNFMDMMIVSNLGIVDDDIKKLQELDSVEEVYPSYSKEVLTNIDNNQLSLKIHSLPKDNDNINQVQIINGRYPENENECLVEYNKDESRNIQIGSRIKIYSNNDEKLDDTLKNKEYEVVGQVNTPYYVSHAKGSSNVGSGTLDSFLLIPESNFTMDTYTEALLTIKDSKELDTYKNEYENHIKDNKYDIEELGEVQSKKRYESILKDATDEIKKGEEELEKEEKKANEELENAYNELENSKYDLNNGFESLNSEEESFKNTINTAKNEIKLKNEELDEAYEFLILAEERFNLEKDNIQNEINDISNEINNLNDQRIELEEKVNLLQNELKNEELDEEEKNKIKEEINLINKELVNIDIKIESKKVELSIRENLLKEGDNYILLTKEKLDEGKREIKNQENNLKLKEEEANSSFILAREELNSAKEELDKGYDTYYENEKKVKEEISKGKEELIEARKDLEKIEEGEWYILDRNTNYGYVDFKNSAQSIDSISKIFPVFFFSLAALICLTTMTRMVDEQRVNIGTMKALGYNTFDIMFKYIMYALIASIGGSILGAIIGFNIFPTVIYNAYATMTYNLPSAKLIFDFKLMLLSMGISILTTTLAVVISCSNELKEVPSLLMRPKAPQSGKRILIERIPFLWNKLSFIQKVTFRNIFRYKKRFFMTIIGISGCTALLLTGFGIRDSISSIVDNQYGKILNYDATITYKKEIDKMSDKLKEDINNNQEIDDYISIKSKSFKAINNEIKKDVTIITADSENDISKFINFNDRVTKEKYELKDNEILITEKVAKLLNVGKNDIITLENEDREKFEVKIGNITENYVNHYIYMNEYLYEQTFDEDIKFNQLLIKTSSTNEESLSSELIKLDNISSIMFNSLAKSSFSDMIENLNAVVILIIISAGALAFIVLYNLTNVNISERIREIATIKVLGFYDNEVSSYVFRENIILTVLGTLCGLVLGIFLHRFIMVTAELEFTMFGREIKTMSFVYSGILTMIFAAIVNLFMYHKLKAVKMVESLKSVD